VPQTLQFWIEYGSTYSYLSVARITQAAARHGVVVDWQPFYLLPIFVEQGMNLGPFLPYPNKLEYMWRDLGRRSERLGVPYARPSTYPVHSLLTARVAMVAASEGWCEAFTRKAFALHWTENRLIGSDDNLATAIADAGRDPAVVIARAQSPPIKDGLKAQTERAKALKIFSAPSFVVGDELFWGDDRLEDALEWARAH
jgi:2-hydroxychromene-2-carboxylate isomerase